MATEFDVAAILREGLGDGGAWRLRRTGRGWIEACPRADRTPPQGWKLHVSAVPGSARAVLEQALPVLGRVAAAFKVAESLDVLMGLNEGASGMSQIGKFMTVYPVDDAQAVTLAVELDAATEGLVGPAVPSDRPLRPGSLVHYRFGSFGHGLVQLPHGELAAAVIHPDGRLVADRRNASYEPPPWTDDPFVAAGATAEVPAESGAIAGRWLPVALLLRSPRGTVELGLDLKLGVRCVIKRARRGAAAAASGSDAVDHLRHEAAVLERLRAERIAPEPLGLVEAAGALCLAMEDVPGRTLGAGVAGLRAQGVPVRPREVLRIGRALARVLARLHAHGLVHRDVKPSNFIITGDGELRMIDLELAHEPASHARPYGLGTQGYMSPQQRSRLPPSPSDDVYGLGATLFHVATGIAPADGPRPLELLAPSLAPRVRALIERCLEPAAAARPDGMAAVDRELAACERRPGRRAPAYGATLEPRSEAEARERARTRALALGSTLARSAVPAPGGVGRGWDNPHESARGFAARDLNVGTAGGVLALAELAGASRAPELRAALLDTVAWLVAAPAIPGGPLPGLYVGEAGVALALARSGQMLALPELIDAASERLLGSVDTPHRSPDLFNGSAGRLRAHVILHDLTGDARHLRAATAAARAIAAAAEPRGSGLAWTIPDDHGGLSGHTHVGYAHGAAGIGDALLDLVDATGDTEVRETAAGAARWVAGLARRALPDGSGREWPPEEGAELMGPIWCHGSCGVGQFLAHAAVHDLAPGELAEAAARTVAFAGRSLGPVQCHGLAGSVEFLLDRFAATDDERHLAEARILERLLDGFAVDTAFGPAFHGDRPGVVAPSYMIGFAGVAMALLRLGDPERRPRQLSRAGFAFREGGGGQALGRGGDLSTPDQPNRPAAGSR